MSQVTRMMAARDVDMAADAASRPREFLDERRFHDLYARTAAPLRAYIVRTLGSAAHADDVLQETYLRLLRSPLPTHDPDELRAYAYRIASNLVVDHWRSLRRVSDVAVPDGPAVSRDPSLRLDIGRVFARLTPRERQLVWLAHVEGAAHEEIASAGRAGIHAWWRAMMFRRANRLDDTLTVTRAIDDLAKLPVGEPPLPDPSFIWWKAQLLRRRDAEREATAPIAIGDHMHVGAAILGALALAIGAWDRLPSLGVSPSTALAAIAGLVILLSILAAAAVETLRER
jgi:RNA polymerase sigma-70 factor (ECF subfamily)